MMPSYTVNPFVFTVIRNVHGFLPPCTVFSAGHRASDPPLHCKCFEASINKTCTSLGSTKLASKWIGGSL